MALVDQAEVRFPCMAASVRANRVAVCGAQNFGLRGSGEIAVLDFVPSESRLRSRWSRSTPAGVYDMALEPGSGHVLAAVMANGLAEIWRTEMGTRQRCWKAHAAEVCGVSWQPPQQRMGVIVTCGWDGEARTWSITRMQPLSEYLVVGRESRDVVELFEVRWHPCAELFAVVGSDGFCSVYDVRKNMAGGLVRRERLKFGVEAMCCQWSDDGEKLAIGGSDGRVYIHDMKIMPRKHTQGFLAHRLGVKRVDWRGDTLTSAGYDMDLSVWKQTPHSFHKLRTIHAHSEFITAVASMSYPALIISAGWDRRVKLWSLPTARY